MTNRILTIDDHDGACEEMGFFEKEPMGLAERSSAIIRVKRDILDIGFPGKTSLGKRCVDADRDERNISIQALILFAQIMGLLFAHRGVQRRDHADDADAPFGLHDIDRGEVLLSDLCGSQGLADPNPRPR